jgi:Na+-translocating ferredoxin:NAD+ oxidoreductase subunit D
MALLKVTSPHAHSGINTGQIMRLVLLATVPGILAMSWFFGLGTLINILWAVIVALALEAFALRLRDRPVGFYLNDGSAVVTAVLLGIALPPGSAWWLILVAVGSAILLAKHLYGGLGYNPFNPAMVGYVVVLVSFPREISLWPSPEGLTDASLTLWQTLQTTFTGRLPEGMDWDAITRASPLDLLRDSLVAGQTVGEITRSPIFGSFSQTEWEWAGNLFFLGGLWLLYRRVISWHIPVSMLLSLATIAGVFWVFDPDQFASPAFHVFSGAAIIGAFFIATDPVSGATTPLGRVLFGAGIGILTYVIRTWGGYPDGVAFAVLLMNMVAPTLDHYTRPRIFGHSRDDHA